MSPQKIINSFFIIICVAVLGANFASDLKSRCNALRTGYIDYPLQQPFYGSLPVPGTASDGKSYGALGADFSQVYFSAQALNSGESAYLPTNPAFKDPLGRPPNYPPVTNHLYRLLAKAPYDQALLIHTFGTLLLFLTATVFFSVRLGLSRHLWKIIVADILLYLYTPLGFSHFERGQFDFIVALSYLCLFSYLFARHQDWWALILSGAAGAIKWSSFPFLGTICLTAFAGTRGGKKWFYVLPILTIMASVIAFSSEVRSYWPSLRTFEFNAQPAGITFMYFLPPIVAKNIQLFTAMVIAMVLFISKEKNSLLLQSISFPLAITMFMQGMCYGTVSYEYRIITILGLLPGFVVWLESTEVVPWIKQFCALFFSAIIIISFRTYYFFFFDLPEFQAVLMSASYLAASMISLTICLYIIFLASSRKTTNFASGLQPPG